MNIKLKELAVAMIVLSSFIFANCEDGTDVSGLDVSAGLYMYTLQVGGLTLSGKMVLMK